MVYSRHRAREFWWRRHDRYSGDCRRLVYGLFTLTIGRKLLRQLGVIAERNDEISPTLLGVTLMLLMLGSWTTDAIGIHSVFGGFILGVAMLRGFYTEELRRQLEPVAVVFRHRDQSCDR